MPKNLLIVDDEPAICDVIKAFADKMELFDRIIIANDGTEAWNKLQNQAFDLIILDVVMPKKSGLELLKQLKAEPRFKNTSVIIVSGNFDEENVKEAIALGARTLLAKPFTMEDIENKIKECLPKE